WARATVPNAQWLDEYSASYAARPRPIDVTPPSKVEVTHGSRLDDVTEFHDGGGGPFHDAFPTWRREHPHGSFLRFDSRTKARLHATTCVHSGDTEWTTDDFEKSLTKGRKVCGADAEVLRSWAGANAVELMRCAHC